MIGYEEIDIGSWLLKSVEGRKQPKKENSP